MSEKVNDCIMADIIPICQAGSDRAQQGGLLKQCLACWNLGSSSSEAGLQESAVQDTVEMLVSFVEQSHGPSAADIVDIAQVCPF